MPDVAKVSIFTNNDLTHITDDYFEVKLIARQLNQIHIIPTPFQPPRYNDAPLDEFHYSMNNHLIGHIPQLYFVKPFNYFCFLYFHKVSHNIQNGWNF